MRQEYHTRSVFQYLFRIASTVESFIERDIWRETGLHDSTFVLNRESTTSNNSNIDIFYAFGHSENFWDRF